MILSQLCRCKALVHAAFGGFATGIIVETFCTLVTFNGSQVNFPETWKWTYLAFEGIDVPLLLALWLRWDFRALRLAAKLNIDSKVVRIAFRHGLHEEPGFEHWSGEQLIAQVSYISSYQPARPTTTEAFIKNLKERFVRHQ